MNMQAATLPAWRMKGIGILRIVFGLIWAIDAWFKWQPDFINHFSDYLTGPHDGQPVWVQSWINFWFNIIKVDPHVFAHLVALGETAVAIGLLFGLLSNLTTIIGILLSIIILSSSIILRMPPRCPSISSFQRVSGTFSILAASALPLFGITSSI